MLSEIPPWDRDEKDLLSSIEWVLRDVWYSWEAELGHRLANHAWRRLQALERVAEAADRRIQDDERPSTLSNALAELKATEI